MKNIIKELAKNEPVKAIIALVDQFDSIDKKIDKISNMISSEEGNGNCLIHRIGNAETVLEDIKSALQRKEDDKGEPEERRGESAWDRVGKRVKTVWYIMMIFGVTYGVAYSLITGIVKEQLK